MTSRIDPPRRIALVVALAAVVVLFLASSATAASPSLSLRMTNLPTHLAPGGTGEIWLSITNDGTSSTSGQMTATIDPLPPGLTATSLDGPINNSAWVCDLPTLTCTRDDPRIADGETTGIVLAVDVSPEASGTLTTSAEVSGGGAASVTANNHAQVDSTSAGFGITTFTGEVTANQQRDPATQAASHPFDASTTIEFNTVKNSSGQIIPAGQQARDIVVDLPPGFVGNPLAATKCTESQLNFTDQYGDTQCPVDSQVGVTTVYTQGSRFESRPVFNMAPPDGVASMFGFNVFGNSVHLNASVRTRGDYGLTVTLPEITQAVPMTAATLTFWGVPADPIHDTQRSTCYFANYSGGVGGRPDPPAVCRSEAPLKPFLTNPSNCAAGPLTTTLTSDAWDNAGVFDSARFDHDVNGVAMQAENCADVPFDPSVSMAPTTSSADGASGLSVDIGVPQDGLLDPNGLGSANLKKAVVQLPEGVSVNPSGATGLAGCTDDQLGLGSDVTPACPDGSKIGSVDIATPLLEEHLTGDVFLRTPASLDPMSGDMLRLVIVARSEARGVQVKLPGSVTADPTTGRLTATFDNNPQLPFDTLKVTFKGGQRGILAMPQQCGTSTSSATLTPWSGTEPVTRTVEFHTTENCSNGFAPGVSAGMSTRQAGASGVFSLRFSRRDGEQYFKGLTAVLPPGLLANVGSVPLCASAAAAAGACPEASRIGSADASAGSGDPFVLQKKGDVYLTEGYKGGPYGLMVRVPVEAGPFVGAWALPTVVVRQALFVDARDAHVTAVSDDFPTIVSGIPLRIRSIAVKIDRPEFMLNPTNCAEKTLAAHLQSTAGATANIANRFQPANCTALAFRPKLNLALTNKTQTKDGGHPGVLALVRQQRGEAGIRNAKVMLPMHLALDPDNANSLCEYADGLRSECPAASIVGKAVAVTPILKEPLSGPVYFVKGVRFNAKGQPIRTLPTLLVKLTGEHGIRVDLRATSNTDPVTGQLINTFQDVPDAPISSFSLQISGGKHGILVVTHGQDICKPAVIPEGQPSTVFPGSAITADIQFAGQNTKTSGGGVTMATPCNLQVYSRSYTTKKMKVVTGGFTGPGTLKITGSTVKTTTRKIISDNTDTATITATMTATGKRQHRAGKSPKIRLSFTPTGAKTETATYPTAKKKAAAKKRAVAPSHGSARR